MARIHRIGQTKKVTYIHILAKGTVDEAVTNRLNKKQDLATTVVDDLKNLFGEVEGMSKALTEKLEALKKTIERGEKITEKALKELQQWEDEEEAKFDELDEPVETEKKAEKKKSKKSKDKKEAETKKNKEKVRSEEHTSELQSRENLVCRLLLEKKKNNKVV